MREQDSWGGRMVDETRSGLGRTTLGQLVSSFVFRDATVSRDPEDASRGHRLEDLEPVLDVQDPVAVGFGFPFAQNHLNGEPVVAEDVGWGARVFVRREAFDGVIDGQEKALQFSSVVCRDPKRGMFGVSALSVDETSHASAPRARVSEIGAISKDAKG